MPEHPDQWRYLCSEVVTIDYEAAPGSIQQHDANLEEISLTAAVLLLDTSIRLGAAVSFRVQNHPLRGVVDSWVYQPPLGYFVSVRFASGFEWSETDFRPAHMLKMPKPTRAKTQDAS